MITGAPMKAVTALIGRTMLLPGSPATSDAPTEITAPVRIVAGISQTVIRRIEQAAA